MQVSKQNKTKGLRQNLNPKFNDHVSDLINSSLLAKSGAESLSIKYSDFLQILLTHQLNSHLRFMKKYADAFESVDSKNNGIISDQEFLIFLSKIYPSTATKNLDNFYISCLELVDPFRFNRIIFSQVFSYLFALLHL